MKEDQEKWLGIQRIATHIGADQGVLRRYAYIEGVVRLLSGQPGQGAKGNRFPESSLPLWEDIARLHKMRAITPGTAAQALPLIWSVGAASGREHSAQEAVYTGFEESYGIKIAAALERLADAAERALPPQQAEVHPTTTRWRRPVKR